VDEGFRDVLNVEGRRRLLLGTTSGPDKAGFPLGALIRRRAIMTDLYGAVADLPGDAALLDSLRTPVYVLYRASDHPGATPWSALDADTAGFERDYDADGFRVYRRKP
jgi:hypothetical protein